MGQGLIALESEDRMDASMTRSEVAISEVINTKSGEDGMDAEMTRSGVAMSEVINIKSGEDGMDA